MERREALKGLGLSFGYVLTATTAVTLLQGCKSDIVTWTPKYLSIDEGIILKNLVDLILPQTDTSPGALDVNVPEFMDIYFGKAMNKEDQEEYKNGLQSIKNYFGLSEENPISNLSKEDYNNILVKYLRAGKKAQEEFVDENELIFDALVKIRNTSVWAYRTSQKIGEEYLAYDPIPGAQLGCISLEEATGGKRWSL